jgi:hypothetical protein
MSILYQNLNFLKNDLRYDMATIFKDFLHTFIPDILFNTSQYA